MYTIPTIPSDLRHEETIIQAAIALDCLHKTINLVFERIDARIGKNNAKVQELGQRIDKAQAKIKGLVGTKKAIKIYAPARFPVTTQLFRDIPQTFTAMESQQQQHLHNQHPYDVQSRVDASSAQTYQEKLVFFHVRSMQQQTTTDVTGGSGTMIAAAKTRTNQRWGMGAMPKQLRSVSSLLLFNTDERVYDVNDSSGAVIGGVEKDTWKRARLFKNQRQRTQAVALAAQNKQLLEPAPHSLANRNQKLTPSGGLRYTPRLNEAPEINLPLDLPDLPGIADDIHFEGKEQQQIAPSLFIENLPELPELLEENQATEESAMASGNSDPVANAAPGTTINIPKLPTTTAPLPPPPPPPLPLISPSQSQASIRGPPPPPPPPPPSLTDIPQHDANKSSTASAGSDTRSELMDAIRKAGGAKGGNLRRATAAAPVVDTVDSHDANLSSRAKPKAVGGDLMADLHNKLLMRRKGISGAKENTNATASSTAAARTSTINDNSVISRLSALIPPPSAPTARRLSDDDDDADNDWVD